MEGPSLFILQRELQFLVNSKILDAYGNAAFDKRPLINKKIYDIYSYGKRLIIQCKSRAIITHFLMYGTYRINDPRIGMEPRLAFITNQGSLYVYNCSVKLVQEAHFKDTLDFSFDILSPEWNIKKVIKAIKKHPRRSIDDILLDQTIFAGVGNIIKNEALFLSHVSPLTPVSKLSDKQLETIALQTREFSFRFVQWRENFELKKHLLIYRKKYCPTCNTLIVRKKSGLSNRISFFCPHCQKNNSIKK